ncbi:MAG: cytochrome c1 [Methylococcales bacterium]|nr:cytochrome c1 [Methylococcales bacterium]
MKNLIFSLLLVLLPLNSYAAGDVDLQSADIDLTDTASLERGAEHYVSYCLGCHAVKYIRYLRLSRDLDIPEKEVLKEVAPVGAGIYDKMQSAMNAHDARKWFGTEPPDLSLIARSRGADWINTYLKSFYTDAKAPTGSNNTVFPEVGMPNMLWQLQGEQTPVYTMVDKRQVLDHLENDGKGTLTEEEFDLFVNDLVNFLVYASEPAQLERQKMGKYVLFFIFMFLIVAYLLKKEYWKDIH